MPQISPDRVRSTTGFPLAKIALRPCDNLIGSVLDNLLRFLGGIGRSKRRPGDPRLSDPTRPIARRHGKKVIVEMAVAALMAVDDDDRGHGNDDIKRLRRCR